jgi:hypothetical protein
MLINLGGGLSASVFAFNLAHRTQVFIQTRVFASTCGGSPMATFCIKGTFSDDFIRGTSRSPLKRYSPKTRPNDLFAISPKVAVRGHRKGPKMTLHKPL